MKNKGFTLIEIIGVLVILISIILTIFPIVIKRIDSSKEKAYQIQIDSIRKAAENWALKNISSLPDSESDTLTINLGDLKVSGSIDMNVVNPVTKVPFPNDMLITITKKDNEFDIEVIEDSGTPVTEENVILEDSPIIILNGSYLTYVELNETYNELWANAYSHDGNDLSSLITSEILKNNIQQAFIDTTQIGTYTRYYIIVDPNNGYRNTAIRTIIIRDTTPPELSFEETTTIPLSSAANFDYFEGVTASDNSNTNVDVRYNGHVENKVGDYVITYTAIDSYNNKATKKRIIKVK